ncbi:hypothetical protein [Pandoraea oxalativorans]|uniref:DoxX family protein n=1 Tax=Pandoraea oxalativorans TaxID=573737 RepID=A0A0E3U5S6_9BURK|nr:hypothetical protein [Pandoraea oxalativorans]AKC69459.1 DoxX family protein [Pandoraea oxalativorans]
MIEQLQKTLTEPRSLGRAVLTVMRLYLGGWMIVSGLSYWLPVWGYTPVWPQPLGTLPASNDMLVTMISIGLFHIVKTCEILGGLCLLFDIFVPFGLVLLLPVSFVVWYNAIVLNHRFDRIFAPYMGVGCLYLNLLLLLAYIRYYIPLFSFRSSIGGFHDAQRVTKSFKESV